MTFFLAILIQAEPAPSSADPLSLSPLFSLPIAFVGAVCLLVAPWFEESDVTSDGSGVTQSRSPVLGIIIMLFQVSFFSIYLVYYRRWLFLMGPCDATSRSLELELNEMNLSDDVGGHTHAMEHRQSEGADSSQKEQISEITRETLSGTSNMVPIGVCRRWKDYPVTAVSYFTLIAGVLLIIPTSLKYMINPLSIQQSTWDTMRVPLFYAVVMTGFLYCCNSVGLKHLPSSVVSAFLPLGVLFTISLSKITLDQELSQMQVIGVTLIVLGVGVMILSGLWKEYKSSYLKVKEEESTGQEERES